MFFKIQIAPREHGGAQFKFGHLKYQSRPYIKVARANAYFEGNAYRSAPNSELLLLVKFATIRSIHNVCRTNDASLSDIWCAQTAKPPIDPHALHGASINVTAHTIGRHSTIQAHILYLRKRDGVAIL